MFLVSPQSSFSTSSEGTLIGEKEEGKEMKGEEKENKEKTVGPGTNCLAFFGKYGYA